MVTPESAFLLRLHEHYKSGLLPYAGGLLDQPHFYAEAMEILSEREAQIKLERAEDSRRAAEANARLHPQP